MRTTRSYVLLRSRGHEEAVALGVGHGLQLAVLQEACEGSLSLDSWELVFPLGSVVDLVGMSHEDLQPADFPRKEKAGRFGVGSDGILHSWCRGDRCNVEGAVDGG